MKKITKLLSVFAVAGLIGTGVAGIAACSNSQPETPEHTHTAATEWQSDATNHWHNCTADDGAKLDVGAHEYTDAQDTTCNVCGYERTVVTPPAAEISITITGSTTVAAGGTIQLTATVTGVAAGGDTGVTWAVDDTTVATVDENGLVTTKTPGAITVTATSKADTTVSQTYSIIVTQPGIYDTLAAKSNNIIAENFSSYSEGATIDAFTEWGTAGVYAKETVTVTGGQAKGLNSAKTNNISLMVDFGAVEGVVEGYFKYGFLATASGEGNSINFYNESGKVLTLITNGTSYVIKNIPGVGAQPTTSFTCDVNAIVEVNFKFDLTNKTVTLKLDNTVICEDLACDISELVGFEVVTSNGGLRGIVVDDIAVCADKLTLGTYVERTNAKVTALENTYGLDGNLYNNSIKGAYESAISAAATTAEVDAAYDALYAEVLNIFVQQAEAYVEGLWTEYTHDATKVTALKETICGEIKAMTDIADVYAVLSNDFADRLVKEDIHEDSYYAQVDVTVVIYEKGTTTSVVKVEANLTDKEGEVFTLAQLRAAITVPSGELIKALYSDEACTTAITGDLTLNAGGATEAATMTIYVEFVTPIAYTADNCGLAAGDKLAATENSFFSIENTSNSHALVALTAEGGGTTAAANDDSGLVFSNAFLAGGNSKILTVTAKQDMKLIVYYTITNSDFNNVSQTKTGYLTWTIGDVSGADTNQDAKSGRTAYACEITLKAGDVCALTSNANRFVLFGLLAI